MCTKPNGRAELRHYEHLWGFKTVYFIVFIVIQSVMWLTDKITNPFKTWIQIRFCRVGHRDVQYGLVPLEQTRYKQIKKKKSEPAQQHRHMTPRGFSIGALNAQPRLTPECRCAKCWRWLWSSGLSGYWSPCLVSGHPYIAVLLWSPLDRSSGFPAPIGHHRNSLNRIYQQEFESHEISRVGIDFSESVSEAGQLKEWDEWHEASQV